MISTYGKWPKKFVDKADDLDALLFAYTKKYIYIFSKEYYYLLLIK